MPRYREKFFSILYGHSTRTGNEQAAVRMRQIRVHLMDLEDAHYCCALGEVYKNSHLYLGTEYRLSIAKLVPFLYTKQYEYSDVVVRKIENHFLESKRRQDEPIYKGKAKVYQNACKRRRKMNDDKRSRTLVKNGGGGK